MATSNRGKSLTDKKRDAILADLRTGAGSIRAIAKTHGVSSSTVSTLAKKHGIHGGIDRTKTAAATEARKVDLAARRAEIKAALLDDVERLRERAWSAYEVVLGTGEGPAVIPLDLPPLRDQRDAYSAIGTAITKHIELEKVDQGRGANPAASFVGDLAAALGMAYDQLTADDGQADDGP